MEIAVRAGHGAPPHIRHLLRRARRGAAGVVEHFAPSRLVPLRATSEPASVAFLSVYRYGNLPVLRRLLDQLPAGAEIRLWALDRVHEDVADLTVGSGPGGRLDLLNILASELTAAPEMLVIADDDVEIVMGDLRRLVRAGSALGFDLFQGSHAAGSASAFAVTRTRPLSFARETSFVEQGPLLLLSARAQRALLPFPADLGMGWGIELRWWRAARELGLRLGVVDAVSMRHFRGAGRTYDTAPERARLRRELDLAGVGELHEVQRTTRTLGPVRAWREIRQRRQVTEPVSGAAAPEGASRDVA
jgi:hypothetical protein